MMGGGYVLGGEVARVLVDVHARMRLKFTPIEDATLGFWLASMDLRHVDHPRFFTWAAPCCFKAPFRCARAPGWGRLLAPTHGCSPLLALRRESCRPPLPPAWQQCRANELLPSAQPGPSQVPRHPPACSPSNLAPCCPQAARRALHLALPAGRRL